MDARPSGAKIRILNINPKFYQGIELGSGKYHLEVSSNGYVTKREWIRLESGEDKNINIRLKPVAIAQQENSFTNSLGMEFVYIKPGTFMMGSPLDEPNRDDNEKQHKVTLTSGFYMQTTEVTQGQWKAVMDTRPWSGKKYVRDADNNPAVFVSWNDAQEFIEKLNSKEGGGKYRLPTEAEWEYACRAGSTTMFYFGSSYSQLGDYVWYYKNARDAGDKYAHRVGVKKPNAWGLYDMHGNVYEWCQDLFDDYPSGSVTDPQGSSSGSHRVYRGGCWNDYARYCRSAYRLNLSPGYRYNYLGFRLSRTF